MLPESKSKNLRTSDWNDQQRLIAAARHARAEVLGDLTHRLGHWLRGLMPAFRRRSERRQIEALAALDDRLLTDIGLSRSDIRALGVGQLSLDDLADQRGGAAAPSATILEMPDRGVARPVLPERRAA